MCSQNGVFWRVRQNMPFSLSFHGLLHKLGCIARLLSCIYSFHLLFNGRPCKSLSRGVRASAGVFFCCTCRFFAAFRGFGVFYHGSHDKWTREQEMRPPARLVFGVLGPARSVRIQQSGGLSGPCFEQQRNKTMFFKFILKYCLQNNKLKTTKSNNCNFYKSIFKIVKKIFIKKIIFYFILLESEKLLTLYLSSFFNFPK